MLSKFSLLIGLSLVSLIANAQAFLQLPIEGQQGKDWIIVNYVDWDTTNFKDHKCGSKSYDGHQGTDFSIRSFKQMDEEIAVYASAAGRVTFTKDGEFDRETTGDISKRLGNYIGIKHPNKYYTYYGHLKKNSIVVSQGDSVTAGDLIGYVGSSGNSTDPHLHFEVWYDSLYVVDPFTGNCGNSTSLFLNAPSYDTSITVWETGIHLKNDLTINDLRERITTLDQPYLITPDSDSSLNFWAHMYGLRAGKELSLIWYTPSNTVWFNYSITLDRDYWYYYYWSFINHTNLAEGDWNIKLNYDGSEIANTSFTVSNTASIGSIGLNQFCKDIKNISIAQLRQNPSLDLKITNMFGTTMSNNSELLASGMYVIQVQQDDKRCLLKKYVSPQLKD
ncbi:MAG: hypothetical protein COA58_10120 [Bacteroidetes bacterium]|nr:MAG: hypothetical protein COA58_10120 [Bacteroidota bacterium]